MIPRLLAITPGDGRDLAPWLVAMGRAGLPGVLLREPRLDERVLDVAIAHVPTVILHARTPGAAELADERGLGLHLPSRVPLAPRGELFGVSCHSGADLDRAFAAGASWCLLSPVWRPTSKPTDDRPPLGLAAFLRLAGDRPVLALGGVDPDRYASLVRAGGRGAAVLGGLFVREGGPEHAAARVLRYLGGDANPSTCP